MKLFEAEIDPERFGNDQFVSLDAAEFRLLTILAEHTPMTKYQVIKNRDGDLGRIILFSADFEELANQIPKPEHLFRLWMPQKGEIVAWGVLDRLDGSARDNFRVLAESQAANPVTESLAGADRARCEELISEGILVPAGRHLRFTKSHVFETDSKAAKVVCGSPQAGATYWKNVFDRSPQDEDYFGRT